MASRDSGRLPDRLRRAVTILTTIVDIRRLEWRFLSRAPGRLWYIKLRSSSLTFR